MDWYQKTVDQTVKHWGVKPERGLSADEVQILLDKHGPNQIKKTQRLQGIRILLRQFKSPLIYILLGAGLVTFFLGEILDTLVIAAALIVNAVVGFFQEYKASSAFEKLKKSVTHQALVRRNGRERLVESTEIVPGDILILKAGDRVAADGRLLKTRSLQVDEAQLTGESFPVSKTSQVLSQKKALADRANMVFMGTVVQRGEGEAIVTATGRDTQLGRVAQLVQQTTQELTPFQLQIRKLGKIIGGIVVMIALMIFLAGLASQSYSGAQVLITSVAVAVAAVPEGLPVALTVVLALAATRILRKKGLIRRLVASETLGSANLIATDKTGTLTYGKMAVAQVIPDSQSGLEFLSQDPNRAFLAAAALNAEVLFKSKANRADWELIGSGTDRAIVRKAIEKGIDLFGLAATRQPLVRLPFDTARKFLLSVWPLAGGRVVLFVSGAPERLLGLSMLNHRRQREILSQVNSLASEAYRVIAVAYKELTAQQAKGVEKLSDKELEGLADKLSFAGLLALEDPIRPEAKRAIQTARQAGIQTIMVTGDHPLTARAIGKRLGFKVGGDCILTGAQLEQMSVEALERRVESISVYARVSPEHKLKIIEAWQRQGAVVAMTGDGVNDAPALKKADIGVAVGSGTEVAKESADLVLLDDNFATIVESIRQGRTVFSNMKKTALYLLADSFSESTLIFGAIILSVVTGSPVPLPILAAQILWVNLVDDSFSGFSFAFEPPEAGVMSENPRSKRAPIFTRAEWDLFFIIGLFTGPVFLALFWWFYSQGAPIDWLRTMIFAGVGLDALLYAFSIKALHQPVWRVNLLDNKPLIAGVSIGILTLLAGIYFPPFQTLLRTVALSPNDWGIIGLISFGLIAVIELAKILFGLEKKAKKLG